MKYARLLSRIHGVPLAIEQAKLEVITSNVVLPLMLGQSVGELGDVVGEESYRQYLLSRQNDLANFNIINVFDSLVSKNGTGDSGSTSYESITKQTVNAISAGAKKLFYYLDTPGGEVFGLFGLANFINSLPGKYGVETIGLTDGSATSAGYVLLASTQRAYALPSSLLGSIGVIMTRVDVTAADKEDGIKYEILRSKDEKALTNPHEVMSDKEREDAYRKLSVLDNIMNETIIKYRPQLSLETILDLKGRTILGEEALSLGLIDQLVSSPDELFSVNRETNKTKSLTKPRGAMMATDIETLQAEVVKLQAENATLKAELQLAPTKYKADEKARILGIMKAGTTFKLDMSVAEKFINNDSSIEQATDMMELVKSAVQDQTAIQSAQPTQTTLNGQTIPNSHEELSAKDMLLKMSQAGSTTTDPFKGLM
jgi:ClpP class serine protease